MGAMLIVSVALTPAAVLTVTDRKSTRLNSSHVRISYAVFCLKKEKHTSELQSRPHLVCRLLLEIKKPHVQTSIPSPTQIPASATHTHRRTVTIRTSRRTL